MPAGVITIEVGPHISVMLIKALSVIVPFPNRAEIDTSPPTVGPPPTLTLQFPPIVSSAFCPTERLSAPSSFVFRLPD